MNTLRYLLLIAFLVLSAGSRATTWDEPWQDKVIREADCFVLAKVLSYKSGKYVKLEIIKVLAGKEPGKKKIRITGFYALDLCSGSGLHHPFDYKDIKEAYFFIKKNQEGKFCIATPTSGFNAVKNGEVYATYRHSYHQALVPKDHYERTMTAIFNHYHGQAYDTLYIKSFVEKQLSLKPAGFSDTEIKTFFLQHAALECVYHLRLAGFCAKLLPFLADTSNFHNQVSAARALRTCNTSDSKAVLMQVIADSSRSDFVKVICIWTLSEFKPRELKDRLAELSGTASAKDNGFGGRIMDPRICTRFPNVKEALNELIATL